MAVEEELAVAAGNGKVSDQTDSGVLVLPRLHHHDAPERELPGCTGCPTLRPKNHHAYD